MLHAYLQNLEHSAIANADGVADKIHGLQLNYQGDWLSLKLFDNPIELYQWQTEHRDPQRQYDPNYEKHSKEEKTGKKGQPISAITYTKEQLEQFLKLAVRASRTNAELYFHDVEMGITLFSLTRIRTHYIMLSNLRKTTKRRYRKFGLEVEEI